jgi:hypothetical protein
MAQTDPRTEEPNTAAASKFRPTAFLEMGKQRLDATVAVQTELLEQFREMNRAWLARVQSEVELASKLTTKLMAARSWPDATAAWQEWASNQMNLLAEDGCRLVADGQKAVQTGVRACRSNGST